MAIHIKFEDIISMNREELERLDRRLNLSLPEETYLDTAERLEKQGEIFAAEFYFEMERAWFREEQNDGDE